MVSISASLLVPFISSPPYSLFSFCCFSVHMAQNGYPQWPAQLQFEINRCWTNILESPFSFFERKYHGLALARGMLQPWLELLVEHVEAYGTNNGCQNPWEVPFLKHRVWGLDTVNGVFAIKILKVCEWDILGGGVTEFETLEHLSLRDSYKRFCI